DKVDQRGDRKRPVIAEVKTLSGGAVGRQCQGIAATNVADVGEVTKDRTVAVERKGRALQDLAGKYCEGQLRPQTRSIYIEEPQRYERDPMQLPVGQAHQFGGPLAGAIRARRNPQRSVFDKRRGGATAIGRRRLRKQEPLNRVLPGRFEERKRPEHVVLGRFKWLAGAIRHTRGSGERKDGPYLMPGQEVADQGVIAAIAFHDLDLFVRCKRRAIGPLQPRVVVVVEIMEGDDGLCPAADERLD